LWQRDKPKEKPQDGKKKSVKTFGSGVTSLENRETEGDIHQKFFSTARTAGKKSRTELKTANAVEKNARRN